MHWSWPHHLQYLHCLLILSLNRQYLQLQLHLLWALAAVAHTKAMQVLLQVVWPEVWLVWLSSLRPLPSSCVTAKPKLCSRLLMILMVKVHSVKLLWTLLPSCNNFLNLLIARHHITAPANILVTTFNHSTTLIIPALGPKTLWLTQVIFTQKLLVWDNSPTPYLNLGITVVFLSCRVDMMCMLVESNYVTHLLTLWFHDAVCTLYPTVNSIVGLATHKFTCQISVLLENLDIASMVIIQIIWNLV